MKVGTVFFNKRRIKMKKIMRERRLFCDICVFFPDGRYFINGRMSYEKGFEGMQGSRYVQYERIGKYDYIRRIL